MLREGFARAEVVTVSDVGVPGFRVLGAVEVELGVGGAARSPGGAVLGRLLSRLLVGVGERVEVGELMEAVWGSHGAPRSVSTLESHLHRLRRFLEPERRRGEAPALLVADAGGYRLAVGRDRLDSASCASLVREASELLAAGEAGRAVERAEQARALWRGRPFAPWSDETWAAAVVAGLEEMRRQLTETLVDGLLAGARPERALVELGPVLAEQPLRERPWEQYLLAAARMGRTEDAMVAYRQCDRLFRDELGVAPGAELQRLHRLVLSGSLTFTTTRDVDGPIEIADARTATEIHLPTRRPRLIGRDIEVADLARRLVHASTVTVVGGAGCGKTTLAVATAERMAAEFPDGIWFVDLSPAPDGEQVGAAVISALGLTGAHGSAHEVVGAFVGARRMLVVLDNCEHVLDAVAVLVERLHRAGSRLAVLATSREPLGTEGEELVELSPLALGDSTTSPAVELFLERYAAAGPDRRLGSKDLRVAAEICTSVDGVPLAIELAAARGRAFSLVEIAEQVRTDPGALSGPGRGRSERQTVRAAVERSVRLLSSGEQELHAALSAVPGPMTAAMAAALIGGGPDTDDLVVGLVHRSLLVAEGPRRPGGRSRFVQLAIVRAHGARMLDDAAADRIADRRDEAVVGTVLGRPRVGAPELLDFRAAMDDDLAALRASLHHSLVESPSWRGPALVGGLSDYWYYRGMQLEAGRWVQLALDRCQRARPVDAALVAAAVARRHLFAGDLPGARAHVEALCSAIDDLTEPDLLDVGDVLPSVMWSGLELLTVELHGQLAARAREVAVRTGDSSSALQAALAGLVAHPLDPRRQLAEVEAVHSAATERGNREIGWMSTILGVIAGMRAGDVAAALAWSERGLEHHLALGNREVQPIMEMHGTLHARGGDDVTAVQVLAAARAYNRRNATRWPYRSATTAVLEDAARRLGPSVYERAWREGSSLSLAEIAHVGKPQTPVAGPESGAVGTTGRPVSGG
ncbi:BTAD domain-containing putative transcriptional regulator [Actinomycetospora flava]|uniref:BTAD domain-containing putative transcriptional regulator n=1 Tax=Actinomycetospora flava TaxID=3129232 RepID=A0ABU8MGU1_9PSEU